MKKYLMMLAVLLLLSIAALLGGHLWVNSARDRLDIQETVLEGDPAAAAGLAVTYRAQDKENHLFWETTFTPGGTERAKTDFRLSGTGETEQFNWGEDVYLNHMHDGYGMSGSGIWEDENTRRNMMVLPLMDVASRTAAGEERTETVRLADYYEYYPMVFQARGSEHPIGGEVNSVDNSWLRRYFRLKVEADKMETVTVGKDSTGDVVEVHMVSEVDSGYLFCEGAVTPYGIFLIAESRDVYEEPDGRLQCQDGPGVHFIPLRGENQTYVEEWFDISGIRLFYPTGSARTLRLTASPDKEELLLYTEENGMLVLTVLAASTGEVLQRLDLMESDQELYLDLVSTEDLHLAMSQQSDQFCLVVKEGGRYVRALSGRSGLSTNDWNILTDLNLSPTVAWDGERVALVSTTQYCCYYNMFDHNTAVGVWNSDGLCYLGMYDYGLSRDPMSRYQLGQYKSSEKPLVLAFTGK